jgi:hypothetical protein
MYRRCAAVINAGGGHTRYQREVIIKCLNKAKLQHVDALIPLPLITSMSTTSVNHSSTSSIHRVARHKNKTFQQDNAHAHTARATRDFLQQNNVNVMNWPALKTTTF